MQGWMKTWSPWPFFGATFVGAGVLLTASASQAVPIDLTDATPAVTGATTLHFDGISTMGESYWADFRWNEKTNHFDATAYGEEEGPPRGIRMGGSGDVHHGVARK